jgi:PadR family transcriptional regulator, regulatory protein PadR
MNEKLNPFITEMNRGFLQILALIVLEKPMYGYAMIQFFKEMAYGVEESTLYPLLRRLEKNKLVRSKWNVEGNRPKKFYQITDKGRETKRVLVEFWKKQNQIINAMLKEGPHGKES